MKGIDRWQGERPVPDSSVPLYHVPPRRTGTRIPRDGHEVLDLNPVIVQINLVVPTIIPILAPGLSFQVFLLRT